MAVYLASVPACTNYALVPGDPTGPCWVGAACATAAHRRRSILPRACNNAVRRCIGGAIAVALRVLLSALHARRATVHTALPLAGTSIKVPHERIPVHVPRPGTASGVLSASSKPERRTSVSHAPRSRLSPCEDAPRCRAVTQRCLGCHALAAPQVAGHPFLPAAGRLPG